MRIVTVKQMIQLEKEANSKGLGFAEMIHRAGIGLAEIIDNRFIRQKPNNILGLVGPGNNGGDTLIALSELKRFGWNTCAYLVRERKAGDLSLAEYAKTGGNIIPGNEDLYLKKLKTLISESSILLDGILGTGFHLPLEGEIAMVLKVISIMDSLPVVIAVDCPSGVDCSTGQASEESIPADLTICMAAVKNGLLILPAFKYVGEIAVCDIGLPADLIAWQGLKDFMIDQDMVEKSLPHLAIDAHKGTLGTVMIIAGSTNYTGAPLLAGKAAYRTGAGLVRIAIPGSIYNALAGHLPEATWLLLPHTEGVINLEGVEIIRNNLKNISALLLGPGWGTEPATASFFQKLISGGKSSIRKQVGFISDLEKEYADEGRLPNLVIDADSLKLLPHIPHWETLLSPDTILTPHPGEMAILSGLDISTIQSSRINIARDFAIQWQKILVLKGALTVIADPTGEVYINPIATPALAHGGTGDVLAGMITSLIGQGLKPINAAIVGCWIHAQAGLLAAKKVGDNVSVMASDVIESIPCIYKELKENRLI